MCYELSLFYSPWPVSPRLLGAEESKTFFSVVLKVCLIVLTSLRIEIFYELSFSLLTDWAGVGLLHPSTAKWERGRG
jgi:hypothetical protein